MVYPSFVSPSIFRCPICSLPLTEATTQAVCANQHQFDRAREGYLNLLPVQHKHSKEPGDAKVQLQARRHFLQAGYFDGMLSHLFSRIHELLSDSDGGRLLDIGCGEGHFSLAMAKEFPACAIYGVDIAKSGVRMAARAAQVAGQAIRYAVASSYALPFEDASIDLVTRIYAPSKDEELRRVLNANGCLIVVVPGVNHLIGLRRRVYADIRDHKPPPTPSGFEYLGHSDYQAGLTVPAGSDTAALLAMTPFSWRMGSILRQQLERDGLEDRLHFELYSYRVCS
ncbi:putative RNA methyltransferase [Cellvibrio japonicus]|nr:methyltransferase domain-containing protein [Cellvibrio japonicus]QEI11963.1 methyltransferase domain-containing protein [Cellvibrio japonicus]QEI15537.1 methyltransferase domain-containing protein [Cellvibrio japonicus]QEI19116.1 methyltransferase domain-containing protein [Cellvibrio japonicus]